MESIFTRFASKALKASYKAAYKMERVLYAASRFILNVLREIEYIITRIVVPYGTCRCCGGEFLKISYQYNFVPFVYLTCGNKKDDDARCDLHSRSGHECTVSPCPFIDVEGTKDATRKRVEILFDLVMTIVPYTNHIGICIVNVTRDSVDAVAIAVALGFSAWNFNAFMISGGAKQDYIVFTKTSEPPFPGTKNCKIEIDDWRERVDRMHGGKLIRSIVERKLASTT